MARPREFDTDEAIARAMDVFWDLGYDEASLPDLLTGMGLTRGSLYKAFKDKKSLFLRVLEHYDEHLVSNAVNTLTDTNIPDGWDRIAKVFHTAASVVADGDRRGCLLCSAAAGPASYDPDIAAQVQAGLARMRTGFAAALPEGSAFADMLLTQYIGLRIGARSGISQDALLASVDQIVSLRTMVQRA